MHHPPHPPLPFTLGKRFLTTSDRNSDVAEVRIPPGLLKEGKIEPEAQIK